MLKGTSVADARRVMDRINLDGTVVPEDKASFSITITMSADDYATWQRAKEVLTHSGRQPSDAEVLKEAASALLDKRDPLRKAERAEKRRSAATNQQSRTEESQADMKTDQRPIIKNTQRLPIPAATKQSVWLRDKGQCTFTGRNGQRCEARAMLELDHIDMKCRGGADTIENLRLRCRYHNQSSAAVELNRIELH